MYNNKINIEKINAGQLNSKEAHSNLQFLASELVKYDKAYYEDNAPLISDSEYDFLKNIYNKIKTQFPHLAPLERVGSSPANSFSRVEHLKPMLSLANGFKISDIEDFILRIQKFLKIDYFPEIVAEYKIDGLSFNARYECGELTLASTRGDGYIGEDITANMRTIKDFPLKLPITDQLFEVRGEVYINKSDFLLLNSQQQESGKALFSNPRNAASGSLRQLNSTITSQRPLRYFVYAVGEISNNNFAASQFELLQRLANLGFSVNKNYILANEPELLFKFYNNLLTTRDNLDYEIDGVVYKINDITLQKRLGNTTTTPRFAIAHKFPAIIGKTKINNITIQVGKTGALTPVAELEPLKIGGVLVSRASLHNYQEIEELDVRINDHVSLQRAGDVIPKINGVDLSLRKIDCHKFSFPDRCPSCQQKLTITEEAVIRCNNMLNCPAQIYERICHFVSKNALNIEGLGKKQIQFLLNKGYISNAIDIFSLKENNESRFATKLEEIEGWGTKSVSNLFNSIQKAKIVTLDKFIHALAIRNIGENNARILAREFKTAKSFLEKGNKIADGDFAINEKLNNIVGLGHKTICELKNFFALAQNKYLVSNLIEILNIEDFQEYSSNLPLSGQNIVFTGSLANLSRSEAKSQAEKLGARIGTQILNNTNLVIAGQNCGNKLTKATKMGIKIIYENEWMDIVNGNYERKDK